jgi:hypothetical protein
MYNVILIKDLQLVHAVELVSFDTIRYKIIHANYENKPLLYNNVCNLHSY